MAELTDATRRRTAARGWVTRASNKLTQLCDQEDCDLVELNDAIDQFDIRLGVLDEAQTAVEWSLPGEQLDADIEEAAGIRDGARAARIRAVRAVTSKTPAVADVHAAASVATSVVSVDAKLPKLEMPAFSGDVTNWTAFWEQFEAVIDQSDLPDIAKFSYLLSLLKGEVAAAVRGLSLTAANYRSARELLKERFGRPERIIFSHIQDLLNIMIPKHPGVPMLWEMYDQLQAHVRSLEALGISSEKYGVVLTPLVLSRLPSELRMEWAREGERREGDLGFLLEFLQREIERRERSQTFARDQPTSGVKTEWRVIPTAAALHSSVTSQCPLCGHAEHSVAKCSEMLNTPVGQRQDKLKGIAACFRCLSTNKGHVFRRCKERCAQCKGKHHVLLCETSVANPSQSGVPTNKWNESARTNQSNRLSVVASVKALEGPTSRVLLQTVQVQVKGKSGTADVVMLLDTGSDRTYISEALVRKVDPEWVGSQSLAYAAFGSRAPSNIKQRNVYDVCVQGPKGNVECIRATEIPVICSPMYRPAVPQAVLEALQDDMQSVDLGYGQEIQVDILVGLDAYWKLMTGEMIKLPGDMVASRSVFGWVVSGRLQGIDPPSSQVNVSFQLFCVGVSEARLQNFWDLESVGIYEGSPREVSPLLAEFERSVRFCNDRYEVKLPWKPEGMRPKLLNNERLARIRLDSLSRRLRREPELGDRYHEALEEMVVEGVVEEVPACELAGPPLVYYMPHRLVVKESSLSTKVRPVFDASAKGYNGVSLNDCLETGPSLLPDLLGS